MTSLTWLIMQVDDLLQILVGQGLEQDDLVEPVEELRIENPLDLALDQFLGLFGVGVVRRAEPHVAALFEEACPDVGRHDDDAVLEIDRVAERVGQLAVFKNLQQDVVDVRVCLFDLVEQQDGVRVALDLLGQLPTFFVPDVARGRADQLRDRVLLHVLGHVEPDHGVVAAEQERGQRLGHLGLADARGSEEKEGSRPAAWAISSPRGSGGSPC